MVSVSMNPNQMIQFIRAIRRLSGNRRGRLSRANTAIIQQALNDIRDEVERIARDRLRADLSDGPPLSQSWVEEKDKIWSGKRWFVDSQGTTFQVPAPPFALGPGHRAVLTGFLERELTAWIAGGLNLSNPPEIRVGYQTTGNIHPLAGIDAPALSLIIHIGWFNGKKNVPPRPYLNTAGAMAEYVSAMARILQGATNALASNISGVP